LRNSVAILILVAGFPFVVDLWDLVAASYFCGGFLAYVSFWRNFSL
jgi:hypothetical protein